MKTPRKKSLAAIDIGTNSFHLIVVDVDPRSGRFKILDREREIVRLGSGSTDMKFLSEPAMTRGVETLRRFSRIAASLNAPIRAVATSAVREALNKEEFLRRVRSQTGIRIEIASGVEEARLIYLGVLQALPIYSRRLLLIDIGGGSTEFLVGKRRTISYSNSLKLGAVRLTQRFFRSGQTDRSSIRDARTYIEGMLAPVEREVERFAFDAAVGSSGTVLNVARMIRLRREGPVETSLNGFTFDRRDLREVVEEILDAEDPQVRSKIPGIDPTRSDIISAGALILDQSFKSLGLTKMIVSDFALREGVILDAIEKTGLNGPAKHLSDIQQSSLRHVAAQFGSDDGHSRHVTGLALSVFDQSERMHGLGSTARNYLEAAGMLHEVGLYVSHSQHHRHSYYLIRNADLLGYSESEKEIIANIARYHRKSHPKEKHEGYRDLSPEDREVVCKLSAILRIADGLDRMHKKNVRTVKITKRGRGVLFSLTGRKNGGIDLDVWGAERKKGLFEEVFDVAVKFQEV